MRTLGQAGKIVAMCLPPVVMALTGLALLQRRRGAAAAGSRDKPVPVVAVQPKRPRTDRRG